MKNYAMALAAVGTLLGCDALDTPIKIRAMIGSSGGGGGGTCTFQASAEPVGGLAIDTEFTYKHNLALAVENTLAASSINFGSPTMAVEEMAPNEITPLRYEVQWECDTTEYNAALGPLYLPTFSTQRPFCQDRRATDTFIGFDQVPVDAAQISPGEKGVVFAQVIPYQLGAAFADTLRIAVLADRCCREPGSNCDGMANVTACTELGRIFSTIDTSGTLSVASNSAGTPSRSLTQYRTFAIFDGNYMIGVSAENRKSQFGASFPMKLRGVLQAQTGDGFGVNSNPFYSQIELCANCGQVGAGGLRAPRPTDLCLTF